MAIFTYREFLRDVLIPGWFTPSYTLTADNWDFAADPEAPILFRMFGEKHALKAALLVHCRDSKLTIQVYDPATMFYFAGGFSDVTTASKKPLHEFTGLLTEIPQLQVDVVRFIYDRERLEQPSVNYVVGRLNDKETP